MSKLTDTFLRGLKAAVKVQKYSDGGGLYIRLSYATILLMALLKNWSLEENGLAIGSV